MAVESQDELNKDEVALKQRAKQLGEQRDRVEAEIESVSQRLNAPGQPGLKGDLLDKEGFPRSDIDIPRVRADRHRLAVLHTDHKQLSLNLEAAIIAVHEAARKKRDLKDESRGASGIPAADPSATSAGVTTSAEGAPRLRAEAPSLTAATPPVTSGSHGIGSGAAPFAIIDEVIPGSPAEMDGIRLGDYLVAFGSVTAEAAVGSGSVAAVAAELQRSRGKEVHVRVIRAGEALSFTVVPRQWAGIGLLGCHMKPIHKAVCAER